MSNYFQSPVACGMEAPNVTLDQTGDRTRAKSGSKAGSRLLFFDPPIIFQKCKSWDFSEILNPNCKPVHHRYRNTTVFEEESVMGGTWGYTSFAGDGRGPACLLLITRDRRKSLWASLTTGDSGWKDIQPFYQSLLHPWAQLQEITNSCVCSFAFSFIQEKKQMWMLRLIKSILA